MTFKKFSYGEPKQDAIIQLYGYEKTTGKNGKEVKNNRIDVSLQMGD